MYDLVVIGTGMGGGTLLAGLCDSGLRILAIERGDFLPSEEQNWQVDAVFGARRYRTCETWLDGQGRWFVPNLHPWVGGNTKVYGAALVRLRREDFAPVEHADPPRWDHGCQFERRDRRTEDTIVRFVFQRQRELARHLREG